MPVNRRCQFYILLTFSFDFSQGLDYPLLLSQDKLVDFMLDDFCRRDHFDFTGCHDNPRLRGPWTAPDMVRKWQVKNDGSLY